MVHCADTSNSRGLSERDGSVSSQHVKRFQLLRSNSTDWGDLKTLHPGYDTVARGPGWTLEGHSGSQWRMKNAPDSFQAALSRPVHPLHTLLERTGEFCSCVDTLWTRLFTFVDTLRSFAYQLGISSLPQCFRVLKCVH